MGHVVAYALGVCFLISLGIFLEHYLGPKPELTIDEIFDATDRIFLHCKGDYEHTRAMLDELHRWLDKESEMKTLSKELLGIIESVRNKE